MAEHTPQSPSPLSLREDAPGVLSAAPAASRGWMVVAVMLGVAFLVALVLLAAAWLSDIAGQAGMYAVALASGLTDVDAITLSSLRLHGTGALAAEQAATAICLAVAANIFFKAVLAASIGGRELIRGILPGFAAVLLGIVSAYLLLVY